MEINKRNIYSYLLALLVSFLGLPFLAVLIIVYIILFPRDLKDNYAPTAAVLVLVGIIKAIGGPIWLLMLVALLVFIPIEDN